MLNGIVLGESLLNDAVALVLCSSIEEYERVSLTTKGGFEVGAFFLTVAKFFTIFLGSVGLGAGVAFVTAILTKGKGSIQFPLSSIIKYRSESYSINYKLSRKSSWKIQIPTK